MWLGVLVLVGYVWCGVLVMVLFGTWSENDGVKARISSIFSVFYARFQIGARTRVR
jgi:hypothetical protein